MNSHVLAAIRSQPWAIMPEYLAAIEAIALRALDHPAIVAVEADGHKERMVEAVAEMGGRFPGSRNATIRERSEEHTSELQSLMRISYAVFCLKKKTKRTEAHQ